MSWPGHCRHDRCTASIVAAILLLPTLVSCAGQATGGAGDLETVSPEEIGWSSAKLRELARHADLLGYSALLLAHDGRVFFSWGNIERDYKCHSIRKPFLSALYGIYVDAGAIDLDSTMEDLGIDDIPPQLTAAEKQATVRHLLQGRSGIYHEAAAESSEMRAARPRRGSHGPGTFFYYNNWDFNALGTIFEQLTGKKIFEEFKVRIADPIGMQDFDVARCRYRYESDTSIHPQYAFRVSTRDLARFGILYQQGGVWDGKRIIPEDWLATSTTAYSENEGAGFGYLWGIASEGSRLAGILGASGIFFSGVGVHSLVILPELKLVFVLRMDTDGAWTAPARDGNARLYALLGEARIRE